MVFAQPAVPWAAYKDSLKANFSLNAQSALTEVLPITSARRDAVSSTVRLQAQLGFPTATQNRTTTSATAADGTRATTVNDVLAEATGTAPTAAALPAAGTPPEYTPPTESLRVDPILRYYAATALNQEVQLLNKYLDSLDKLSSRFEAYVVRLQVTLQPRRRDWAYDAYTDVVFSTKQLGDPGLPPLPTDPTPAVMKTLRPEQIDYSRGQKPPVDLQNVASRTSPDLIVLPMLVTDSVEAMMRQRSVDQLRELGLALSGMVKGVGVGANIGNTVQRLEELLGKDLNATMTVGRLDRDSIRVRFGAQHQGRSDFAIVPRNHTVTALVLISKPYVYRRATPMPETAGARPGGAGTETRKGQYALLPFERATPPEQEAPDKPRPNLYVFSSTSFVHAHDGTTPPYQSANRLVDDLIAKLQSRGASQESIVALKSCLPRLVDARLQQNPEQFRAIIGQLQLNASTGSAIIGDWLWAELSSWRSKLGMSNEEILVIDSARAPYNSELPASLKRTKGGLQLEIEFGKHAINHIDDVQLSFNGATAFASARTLRIRDDGSALIAEYPAFAGSRTLPRSVVVQLDGTPPPPHLMPRVNVASVNGWPSLPSGTPALVHASEGSKHTLVTLPGTHYADNASDVIAILVDGANRYPAIAVNAGENGHALTARFALPDDGTTLGKAAQLELSSPDFPGTHLFAVQPGPAPEAPKEKTATIKVATNQVARTKDFTAKIGFNFEIPPPAAGAPAQDVRVTIRGAVVQSVTPGTANGATLEDGQIKLSGTAGFVVVDLMGISDPEIAATVIVDKAAKGTTTLKVNALPTGD